MTAVVNSVSSMGTVKDASFTSIAVDIIKSDLYASLTKGVPVSSFIRVTKPHAPADSVSVVQVPIVIAYSSPDSVIEHLHSAFPVRTTTDKFDVFKA